MNPEKTGLFIIKLRKNLKMSQQELADKIPVSRQAVSNWENGKAFPDKSSITRLAKIFNVNENEIMFGEFLSKAETKAFSNSSKNKKLKKILKWIFMIFIFLIFVFLTFYFLYFYNKFNVYTVDTKSNSFEIKDGILVLTNEKIYFKLGNIRQKTEYEIKEIYLYYLSINNKKVFINSCEECTQLDTLLIDFKGYNAYFDYDNMPYILDNMYISIKYDNFEETAKLNFNLDFSNNATFFISNIKNSDTGNNNFDTMYNNENLVKLITENFEKIDDGYYYSANNINAIFISDLLIIESKEYSQNYIWTLDVFNNTLSYELKSKNNINKSIMFNLDTQECLSNSCDNISQAKEKFYKLLKSIFR